MSDLQVALCRGLMASYLSNAVLFRLSRSPFSGPFDMRAYNGLSRDSFFGDAPPHT